MYLIGHRIGLLHHCAPQPWMRFSIVICKHCILGNKTTIRATTAPLLTLLLFAYKHVHPPANQIQAQYLHVWSNIIFKLETGQLVPQTVVLHSHPIYGLFYQHVQATRDPSPGKHSPSSIRIWYKHSETEDQVLHWSHQKHVHTKWQCTSSFPAAPTPS